MMENDAGFDIPAYDDAYVASCLLDSELEYAQLAVRKFPDRDDLKLHLYVLTMIAGYIEGDRWRAEEELQEELGFTPSDNDIIDMFCQVALGRDAVVIDEIIEETLVT